MFPGKVYTTNYVANSGNLFFQVSKGNVNILRKYLKQREVYPSGVVTLSTRDCHYSIEMVKTVELSGSKV